MVCLHSWHLYNQLPGLLWTSLVWMKYLSDMSKLGRKMLSALTLERSLLSASTLKLLLFSVPSVDEEAAISLSATNIHVNQLYRFFTRNFKCSTITSEIEFLFSENKNLCYFAATRLLKCEHYIKIYVWWVLHNEKSCYTDWFVFWAPN